MMKSIFAWAVAAAIAVAPKLAHAADGGLPSFPLPYRTVDAQWSVDQTLGLGRLDVLVQEGSNALNRFKVQRLVKVDGRGWPMAPRQLRGAVILLPPQYSNIESFYIGGTAGMAPYLAQHGFDVYGYTPRAYMLTPGECAARDCSAMAAWGADTYTRDIDAIRFVATAIHQKKPAIGGMSLGAMLTIAAVNYRPAGYAGAIVWEGTLYFTDPIVRAEFQPLCETYTQALAGGVVFDDQSSGFLQLVWTLMQTDPTGASPFADGFTNREYALLLTTMPADPPAGEAPGYTYLVGDLVNGYYYSDESAVGQLVNSWAQYESIALIRDIDCARAGNRALTDHLQLFRGAVLGIEAGHGFGASEESTLGFFTRASSIDRLLFADRAHVDVLLARDEEATVTAPTYNWLVNTVVPRM